MKQLIPSKTATIALILCLTYNFLSAQEVHLHTNPRWSECSFQLDPSLTKDEWRQFTKEAGMVACFRPLSSAKALGPGRVEVAILQWKTGIDETTGAWNNTFVHPDEKHYLVGGPELAIPGLTIRAGLTKKLDAGIYWTTSPGANYSFAGAQLQYNFLNSSTHKVDVSSRLGFNTIYGPEDVNLSVYALDVIASKNFTVIKNWLSLSPYAGATAHFTHTHEKSDRVNLADENIAGFQGMIGLVAGIKNFSLGVEYNKATVKTLSYKIGYNFKLWSVKNN